MADENEQFECPECGSLFGVGVTSCPGCGMEFEWDEEQTEEALDELIEQVEEAGDEGTEPPYDPSPRPEEVAVSDSDEETEPPYDPSPGPEEVAPSASDEETEPPYDPSPEPEVVTTAASYEEMEAPAEVPAEVPVEEAPMALEEPPVAKKKALSMLGIAFAVLAVVSVIGLMVVLNYDTWIKGDAENHIGDTQIMYVYLAAAAVVVCLLVVVFDFVRNRKAV